LANHCSADLVLDHGQLRLANLESEIWGGEHRAELQADFTGAEPAYDLRGTLDNAQLAPVTAPIADDCWLGPSRPVELCRRNRRIRSAQRRSAANLIG